MLNQVVALRVSPQGGFSSPARLQTTHHKDKAGESGVNAGDDASAQPSGKGGWKKAALDINSSGTRSTGRFDNHVERLLATTFRTINNKSVAGIGLGYERANENFDGPAPNRKSDGFTLTGTVARIINENNSAMLVPQIGITYLDKRTEGGSSQHAWRTMGSLALVGTRALNDVELTGIGQLVYTHEDTAGSNGGSSYIAQSVLRGEVAFTKNKKAHPFLGITGSYDLSRSASTRNRFGYEASMGLRAAHDAKTPVQATIAYGERDDQKSTSATLSIIFTW
jgi:hypothetical protein